MTATVPRFESNPENDKFANDGSLASVDDLLRKIAIRCHKRVMAMGLGMDYDDVLQEMYVSYVKARSKWNAQDKSGAKFGTYCTAVCINNFNHAIKRIELQRAMGKIEPQHAGAVLWTEESVPSEAEIGKAARVAMIGTVRFQRPFGIVSECEFTSQDTNEVLGQIDRTAGPVSDNPEQRIERAQEVRANLASLSEGARRLVATLLKYQTKGSAKQPKLREIAREAGIEGKELKQVKLEILKTYGVCWQ